MWDQLKAYHRPLNTIECCDSPRVLRWCPQLGPHDAWRHVRLLDSCTPYRWCFSSLCMGHNFETHNLDIFLTQKIVRHISTGICARIAPASYPSVRRKNQVIEMCQFTKIATTRELERFIFFMTGNKKKLVIILAQAPCGNFYNIAGVVQLPERGWRLSASWRVIINWKLTSPRLKLLRKHHTVIMLKTSR